MLAESSSVVDPYLEVLHSGASLLFPLPQEGAASRLQLISNLDYAQFDDLHRRLK